MKNCSWKYILAFLLMFVTSSCSQADNHRSSQIIPSVAATVTETQILSELTSTSTLTPPPNPLPKYRLSFWSNPDRVREWAIYTYAFQSQSLDKVTQNYPSKDFKISNTFWGNPYTWSDDGKWLAVEYDYPSEEDQIHLYSMAENNQPRDDYQIMRGRAPYFSLVESKFVYIDDGVKLYDIATDQTIKLISADCQNCRLLKVSPKGNQLILMANFETKGDLYRYDFSTGRLDRITTLKTGFILDYEWSSSGDQILVASADNQESESYELYLVTLDDSSIIQENISNKLPGTTNSVFELSWNPIGGLAAITVDDTDTIPRNPVSLFVLNIETEEIVFQLRNKEVFDISWSPDGRYLAYRNQETGRNYITLRDSESDYMVLDRIFFTTDIIMMAWVPTEMKQLPD